MRAVKQGYASLLIVAVLASIPRPALPEAPSRASRPPPGSAAFLPAGFVSAAPGRRRKQWHCPQAPTQSQAGLLLALLPHVGSRARGQGCTLLRARARKLRDDDVQYMDTDREAHACLALEQSNKRVIVVGDVHGCFDELQELLAKVHFHIDTDILCLAGDFCNKGPHSAAVVRFARETGALAVVGNHELLSLRALATMQREGDARQLSESKYAWTRELSAQDIEYMRSLPFTIRLPLHNALVVHAGLTPGRALGKQELISLVTTRTLVRNSGARARWHASTDTSKGVPWASMWRGPEHVYFGHTTRKEVLQTPFATGLDTGCVYGGSLTAAVLEPPAAGDARHCSECGQELVTIKCSNQHKCKVGACSNKHPCKRSDARCPRPGCSTQPLAPRRTLVAVKAAQAYDSNVPWKQPSRAAKTSECQPGAPAPPAKAPLRSAASGNADGSNGRLAAPPAARSAGMTRQVPQGVEARLRTLLSETGPLVQSRFLDAWSARYPDAPFDYSAWGFGRLTSALEAMPSAALLARPQGSRTDTVFPADYGIATDQAEAQDVMRNALGAIVAREASADQAAVAAFLAQPALRFTIDCLVSEYLKYQEQDKRREPPATSRDQRASPEAAEEQAP